MLAMIPFLLIAHPSQPSSLRAVIENAKARPGSIAYAHGGNGSAMHLSGELLKMMAGIYLLAGPYKGHGPVAPPVLRGQGPHGLVAAPSALPQGKRAKPYAPPVNTTPPACASPRRPT